MQEMPKAKNHTVMLDNRGKLVMTGTSCPYNSVNYYLQALYMDLIFLRSVAVSGSQKRENQKGREKKEEPIYATY